MHDRRAVERPSNGDKKACPKCRTNSVEFNERYRLPNARGRTAAWVCDSPRCGYSEPVRRQDRLAALRGRRRVAPMTLGPIRRKKNG